MHDASTTPASSSSRMTDGGAPDAGAVPVGPVHHLDRADLSAASAAAAARAATVRRGAEARARRLRDEAHSRIAQRRQDAAASGRATPRGGAQAPAGAHIHSIHDASSGPRTIAVRLRTLLLTGLAMALVGGLAGGLIAWAVFGGRGAGGSGGLTPPIGMAGTTEAGAVADAVAFAQPSVVSLRISTPTRQEVGSGVVLSKEGLVLTNAHVVTLDGTVRDATIQVTTNDGRVFPASIVALDPLADLAVIRLDGVSDLVPATWADTGAVVVGQPTIVLGAPLGLRGSATTGIVSATNRSIEIVSAAVPPSTDTNVDPTDAPGLTPQPAPPGSSTIHLAVFQTDADINPGNSGGPVINFSGEVIGIAVAMATTNKSNASQGADGSIGLGFAIPGQQALRIATDLANGRTPSHGALGASVMSSSSVTTGGPSVVGAYVDDVSQAGAAARSGIRRGDIITAVNGLPVGGPGDLLAFVRLFEAGEVVTLTIVRQGESISADVTLDAAA